MSRKSLIVLALGLLALVVASAHSQSPSATTGKTIAVQDALVTGSDDNKVPATELGMITAIHVKEGHSIDKDTVVADIDNRETMAKKRIAEGELKAAETQAESDAELEVAEKAVLVAKAELESMMEVNRKTPAAVSLTELRKFQFQLDRALAQVKQAKVERLIATQTAKVKQAQLDATDIELDRRQLKSPFKAQVIEVYKKVGDWVQPGDPVMHVMGLDRLRVKGFVLSSQAAPNEVMGKPAVITIYGAGNKQHTLKGIVGFASPNIEGIGASQQFRIWVDVDNEMVIDPVTKLPSWKIESGVLANMTIDLTPPPPPKPVAPPKGAPGKTGGSLPPLTPVGAPATKAVPAAGKVESFKPALPEKLRDR